MIGLQVNLWITCVFASAVKRRAAMCVQASPIPATMPYRYSMRGHTTSSEEFKGQLY